MQERLSCSVSEGRETIKIGILVAQPRLVHSNRESLNNFPVSSKELITESIDFCPMLY